MISQTNRIPPKIYVGINTVAHVQVAMLVTPAALRMINTAWMIT
jgi:hypothetical protein